MSLKYIVYRSSPAYGEDIIIFSSLIDHSSMADTLKKSFPTLVLVSAGMFSNYEQEVKIEGMESLKSFDSISLHGDSYTLNLQSRKEDLALFKRRADGY